jgi:hypothetical protein
MDALPVAPAVICPCCHQTIPTPFRCEACGGTFTPSRAAQKYCGRACSKAQHRRIANKVKNLDQPYLRRPRSEKAKAATAAKKEQALEDVLSVALPVLPPADETEIEALFTAMRAELAEEMAAVGPVERPLEDIPRLYAVTPALPTTCPTWSAPRRLGQRNAKQARLHAAGIFST